MSQNLIAVRMKFFVVFLARYSFYVKFNFYLLIVPTAKKRKSVYFSAIHSYKRSYIIAQLLALQ